jgi:hypothetical protein
MAAVTETRMIAMTVTRRSMWQIDETDPRRILDEEGGAVAVFADAGDASSAVSDHNRTTRVRIKAREKRKIG